MWFHLSCRQGSRRRPHQGSRSSRQQGPALPARGHGCHEDFFFSKMIIVMMWIAVTDMMHKWCFDHDEDDEDIDNRNEDVDEEDHFERKLDAKGSEVRETLGEAVEHSLAHWKRESWSTMAPFSILQSLSPSSSSLKSLPQPSKCPSQKFKCHLVPAPSVLSTHPGGTSSAVFQSPPWEILLLLWEILLLLWEILLLSSHYSILWHFLVGSTNTAKIVFPLPFEQFDQQQHWKLPPKGGWIINICLVLFSLRHTCFISNLWFVWISYIFLGKRFEVHRRGK